MAAARRQNVKDYRDELREWKYSAPSYSHEDPNALSDHIRDMPEEEDFDALGSLEEDHQMLAYKSGRAVPGPSNVGLGIGYGLGTAGVLAGIAHRNVPLGLAGAAVAAGTGLYHHMAQPVKRYNRYLDQIKALQERKDHLLNMADEDGMY